VIDAAAEVDEELLVMRVEAETTRMATKTMLLRRRVVMTTSTSKTTKKHLVHPATERSSSAAAKARLRSTGPIAVG
jgi:hypothetical protein